MLGSCRTSKFLFWEISCIFWIWSTVSICISPQTFVWTRPVSASLIFQYWLFESPYSACLSATWSWQTTSPAQVSVLPNAWGFLFSSAANSLCRNRFYFLFPRSSSSVSWQFQSASICFFKTRCSSQIALSVSFCQEPQDPYSCVSEDTANYLADFAT